VMLFKMENRNTAYVTLGRISKMIKSFMLGNLFIGAFMSAISIIVFAVIGLPNAIVLGVLSGYLSLVPYLGVVLAMVPPLIAALGQETTPEILAIILTVLGLHLFAINVLYPKVLGRRLQLNPLAVTIALLLWGWLWGAWGLILAVPLTAAMKIVFDHIEALQPYGAWMGE
jgi:predicted PurR-regulated permease PerM